MIHAKYKGQEFTIDTGEITGAPLNVKRAFLILTNDPPGPSEGDPDFVLFDRLKQQFPDITLIKAVWMELDPDVVY